MDGIGILNYVLFQFVSPSECFVKVLSLLCLSFSIPASNTAKLTHLVKWIVIVANSSSSILIMVELSYSYFKRYVYPGQCKKT